MRRLIGPDVGHEASGFPVSGDEVGIGHPRFGPGKRVKGRDLDEENPNHQGHHHLQLVRDVVREQTSGDGAGTPRPEAHPLEHGLDVELLARPVERDVTR